MKLFLKLPLQKKLYRKYTSFILQILEIQQKYALSELPKNKYKWSIKTEKGTWFILQYFIYTSLLFLIWSISQVYFWVWKEIPKFRKSTSSILQSLKINTSILKACFKCTSEFDNIYITFESLLHAYLQEIQLYFKNMFKVCLKYT